MALRPGLWRSSLLMLLLACALSLVAVRPAAASAPGGSLDTTFGSGGYATLSFGTWAGAAAVVLQPNGKIVTAGEAEVAGHYVMVATRMNADSSLDPSFGQGGIVTVDINGGAGVDSGAALMLQTDGKIVMVGGGVDGPYGSLQFAAVRLLTNGSPDPTFGNNGTAVVPIGTTSIATAVAIQRDGAIVLSGTALVGHNQFAAARLRPNGKLDPTFGNAVTTTFGPTAGVWGMALQPDGKLVLAGQADYANPQVSGAQQFMTARLNGNGKLDAGFGRGGIVMTPVGATALGFGVAMQRDGKLVLAGPAFTNTGVNATVRLTQNGSLDPTYGSGGIATIPDWYGANGIILDPSGRIVLPVVGASAIVLNPDGTPTPTFGTGGIALANNPSGGANGAAVQSDGKIVLAGAATVNGQTVISVIRLNGPGARSPLPTPPPTTPNPATATATTPTPVAAPGNATATVPGANVKALRTPSPSAGEHTPHKRKTRPTHRAASRPVALAKSQKGCRGLPSVRLKHRLRRCV